MTGSISAQLASWLADLTPESTPTAVMADAKRRLIDVLGLIVAATRTPIGAAIRTAGQQLGAGAEATVPGYGDRLPAASTALVSGTLAHAEDFDDTHAASVMHASVSVVPLALTAAEAAGSTGAELLMAIAAGNEIACRIALGAPGGFHARGFHPTGVVAALSSAMIAGKLAGLTADQMVAACGVAGSQASGILEAYADGTWSKTMHAGWAAHAGIIAAKMAAAGFTGPATIIEGRFGLLRSHVPADQPLNLAAIIEGLGRTWIAPDACFKPYPCAHASHPFVDAALDLRAKHGLKPEQIAKITLHVVAEHAPMIAEPLAAKLRPRTSTHARASLPYACAAALLHGELTPALYEMAAIQDPRALALCDRMEILPDPEPTPTDGFRGRIQIDLADGRSVEQTRATNHGSPLDPMTDAELQAKFRAGFDSSGLRDRADATLAAIDRLERDGLRPLIAAFTPSNGKITLA